MYDRPMRRLLAGLAVVHATGCDRLLNLEYLEPVPGRDGGGESADGFIPVDCSLVPFPQTTPTPLASLADEIAGDPALAENTLELYFVRTNIVPYEIWRASRSKTSNPFALDLTPMPFNIAGNENTDPSLTADGTVLVFVSLSDGGTKQGYMVTREPGAEWSDATAIPGLAGTTMHSLSMSWDGLTLYYVSAAFTLMQATRATRQDSFGMPIEVSGESALWPTVSADGLEVFYSPQAGAIFHARRETTNQMFGPPTQVETFGADPYLAPSSTELWITYEASVAVLTRTCP